MRYYHIIYTSSQKNLIGSNGFGIRTATEGIPQAYIQAVTTAINTNKFSNDISACKGPSPQELLNDGTAIRVLPPSYFYYKMEITGSSPIYIVGRNISLGFTELFYFKDSEGKISGRGGRTGNFLIDLYLFEERPTIDVFQILDENPEEGKGRFVPADASPLITNTEMASIATGNPEALPLVTDWPYRADMNTITNKESAVNLLFAIIEARLSEPIGKKLVVKCPWHQTHHLIADVMKLMPEERVGDFTFVTNYTGNGYNISADVNFINEYYNTQYIGKDIFIDLESTSLATKESEAYRQIVIDSLNRGDIATVRRLANWMLSAAYKEVRNLKPHTNKSLFIYTQQPEIFSLNMLHEENKEDVELLTALNKLICENSKNQEPFASLVRKTLDETLDNTSPEERADKTSRIVDILEVYRRHIRVTNDIISLYRDKIEAGLMDDPVRAINHLGISTVRVYTHNLEKGLSRQDLARYIFDIEKEHLPQTLTDAVNLIRKYETQCPNPSVLQLMSDNFSSIFNHIFESIVNGVSHGNKLAIATQLDQQFLVPMSDAKNDAMYKRLELLCDVLNDNIKVDGYNYQEVLRLIQRLGMTQSKTGDAVKNQLFEEKSLSAIPNQVTILMEVWHLTPQDIINKTDQLVEERKMDSTYQKTYIKATLENSGFSLEQVIETIKKYNFTSNDIELFLARSPKYQSAYNSYRRKKAMGVLWKMITSLFKRKPKEGQRPLQSAKTNHPKEQNTTKTVDSISVLDENSLSQEERKRLNFYRSHPEIQPKDNDPIKKYLTTLLLFSMTLWGGLNVHAASQSDYHSAYGDIKDAPKCYIVSAKTLNVRTSPSLYKGRRKNTKRKDNVGFKLSQGDTIFVSALAQSTAADGVQWIGFTHEGTDYYTDITKLYKTDNPRLAKPKIDEPVDAGGFIGWLQGAAPWILLVFTIIIFLFSFGINTPDKDSLRGEPRDETGMRPMFMYSLRPYKFFSGLSARLLIALALSIIVMLAIGGIVWGLLWVVKILLWALIIIGWICVVVGVVCIFVNWGIAIPALLIGGVIVNFQEAMEAFGNKCVAAGMAFFDALNIWEFAWDLIQKYWLHAVIISLVPLVLFLIAAVVMIIVAWCLRGYEAFTTHRYNVKHPCPICHEPSEPAEYYDKTAKGKRIALPTKLRPGIYGLLHITHPTTGNRMPTLIANGRDLLLRKCPHCDQFVNFEAGTEKHIGFIGMPGSGKTTLLSAVIGEMQRRYTEMHFTDYVEKDVKECAEFVTKEGCLDDLHLPEKTKLNALKASIQCILPRTDSTMPYHIYFNDVAGEAFTVSNYDKDLLRFAKDVENIFFIVDPMTMELKLNEVSDRMKKWLERDDIKMERGENREKIINACYSLTNVLKSCGRDMGNIHFTFVLVKSDKGYLDGVNVTDASAVESFISNDLHLLNLIDIAEKQFSDINFIAVSVYKKGDKGLKALCDNLIQQLGII